MSVQLHAAYAVCRHVTRSAARNFYYAFLVLPREKREALSAVYAFMRHSDDLSDDPALPIEKRREKIEDWRTVVHEVFAGKPTDDPVLFAVADTQKKFNIPVELFDALITGTAMDTQVSAAAGPEHPVVLYGNFDELYQYCYHVASVVGLICIRIFGYSDPKAEPLAERCGIAFQLTNIIRDVSEDAAMGRIYLPGDDLLRFGIPAESLAGHAMANGFRPELFRGVLEKEAERAEEFYRAGYELLPLIDDDSRPALWALIEIYHQLLQRIRERHFDVFGEKIRLTTFEKLKILGKGTWRRIVD